MNQLAMSTYPRHHGQHHADDGDAVCPVCRARVNSRTAPCRDHDGEAWYFCDDRCLRAFEGRPDFYVTRARAERAQDGLDAMDDGRERTPGVSQRWKGRSSLT